MGTKRANWTIEDPSQLPHSPATADRGYQTNDCISREARPQAGMKVRTEQDREGESRRAKELDRMWGRPKGGRREDQWDREKLTVFKGRPGEVEWQERDRRREEGRHPNGRIASVQDYSHHIEREREKGDTFPRTRRRSNERERKRLSIDQETERTTERGMGRPREFDKTESERERERERAKKTDRDVKRYREGERYRENEKMRMREEVKRDSKGRLEKEESDRTRDRGWAFGRRERRGDRDAEANDQQTMRVKEVDRERDRAGQRDREDRLYFMQRRIIEGDRGNLSDREEREERSRAWRREKHRHTKSDGDSDGEKERGLRGKEDSESLRKDQSKGGRDSDRERTKERLRERERRREVEWQRDRDRGKVRETDALGYRGTEDDKERMMDRYTGRNRQRDWPREERGPGRQREDVRDIQDRRREKEPSERMRSERDRETDNYPNLKETKRRRSLEDGGKGRTGRSQSETHLKVQVQAQNSGELMSGSDAELEQRRREIKDSSEDNERENVSESNRERKKNSSAEREDVTRGQWGGEAREGSEKEEMDRGDRQREKPEDRWRPQRKMWLEPRSERLRTESLEEEFREREREKVRYAERYKERRTSREEEEASSDSKFERGSVSTEDRYRQLERAGEFMKEGDRENIEEGRKEDAGQEPIFDNEGRLDAPGQTETENVEDFVEGSDREEERGSGIYGNSEGEEGSEREWGGELRERVTSGDDGFVTVSSGGDEDEAEEDKFEDCKEFWDGEVRKDLTRQSPTNTHQSEAEFETQTKAERSDHTVTFFCVIGQTLPRSKFNQNQLMEPADPEDVSQHTTQDPGSGGGDIDKDLAPFRVSETAEESVKESSGMPGPEKESLHLSEEDITSNQDTNRLKAEYKDMTEEVTSSQDLEFTGSVSAEKDSDSHPAVTHSHTEDQGNAQNKMTEEKDRENEEIRNTADERKRYSAAPHVKWAKNVLEEILDFSNDGTLNMPELGKQTEQSSDGACAELEPQGDREPPSSPLYGIIQKPRKHDFERKCIDPDLLQHKTEDTESDMQGNTVLIQVERESETEEELEQLGLEKEGLEGDTDEEEYYDRLLPSPDLHSLSSDGEAEKEGSSKKDEKQKKKKTVWDVLGSSSFRDFGSEAWGRRRCFRKSQEKHTEDEDGGGIARDRRTRVFNTDDDEYDELRHSFNESELRNFKARISRTRMRNSKFYNSQLYQQYSEVVQNREILHQSHSDASSVFGEISAVPAPSSPAPSPPPARRPLPPLPAVLHPLSLSVSNNSRVVLPIPQYVPSRPVSPRLSKSFASSPMLWQDLPGVRNNPELKDLSEDKRRLQEVRFEVVTSEASYGSSLDIVVEHFVKSKQLNAHLTTQDKNWLFSRLGDVRAISHSFFTQLEERVESDIMHFTICDIIIKHCPRFRAVYVPYLTNQSYQDKTYQRLMNENSGFRNTVEKLEHSPKCQRLPFRSFLILPFQRITRLKLLVQFPFQLWQRDLSYPDESQTPCGLPFLDTKHSLDEEAAQLYLHHNIVKRTAPKTKDEAEAIKAMKLLEKMIQDSNDSISQMKSIESLVSLNAKVDFECKTLPLISQSRRLVREGPVTELRDFSLKETERSAYIHLFNDYLLLSLLKEGGRFTVIDHAPVSELRAENCRVKLHSLKKNLFRLYMSHKALLLRTETQADKLRWISAVSRPHPEIDLNAAKDISQMQCIRAFIAQQPDELSLEKADVLLVHQQSSDGWVEGTRLSDRHRGWAPESHLETIHSQKARECNLLDALKITAATATV